MGRWRRVGAMAGVVVGLGTAVAAAQDVETVQQRLVEELVTASTSAVDGYLTSQQADGSFTDVNYQDTARTGWEPVKHLQRLRAMAVAYRKAGDPHFGDAAVLDAVSRGLTYWYAAAPVSDNWWFNDIGKQLELGPLAVLLEDALGPTLLAQVTADLAAAPDLTGENRVWISQEVVQRGCAEDSAERVATGIAGILDAIVVTTDEGVQPDYSFHQHGPLLYNAGYGAGFLADGLHWAWLTRETTFAYPAEKLEVLTNLLLEGDRWMVRGDMIDPSADGREITRPNQNAGFLRTAAERAAALVPERSAELLAVKAYVEGTSGPVVTGNRHFWRSDFMVHQRPELYVSIKMVSARTKGTEVVNEENLLGYWLPFGLTYIAPRGDEYENIFPVWDYTLLPGVTAPRFADRPDGTHTATFVGGVSDGENGVAVLDLDKANTTGKKAWFALGDTVVALGTALTSTHAAAVATTLNQCLLAGDVTADTGAVALGEATREVSWLHHDGIGYVFFEPTSVHLRTGTATGSWGAISAAQSSDPVSADVFLAWLDHGPQPSGASYAYALVPAAAATDVEAFAAQPSVTILANGPELQAVQDAALGVTGAVFHAAGVLTAGDLTIGVDQPSLVLVDVPHATVTAANPEAAALTLNVDVTLTSTAAAETVTLELPGAPETAGSSRSAALTIIEPTAGAGGAASGGAPASGGTNAGAGGAGASAAGGTSAAGAGGTAGAGAARTEGGCGCRATRASAGTSAWLALAACALLWGRRRQIGTRRRTS